MTHCWLKTVDRKDILTINGYHFSCLGFMNDIIRAKIAKRWANAQDAATAKCIRKKNGRDENKSNEEIDTPVHGISA